MMLNGILNVVYCNKDESIYRLIAKKDGLKIRGTHIVELTVDEYEKLSCVPDKILSVFCALFRCVGLTFFKNQRLDYQLFY